MRTILLCVNARLLQGRAGRRVEAVRRVFLDHGCRVVMVETLPFGQGPTLTRQMLAALSPDVVVACGGDGTVFDALQSVAGTSIALGVVPFGTANVLAQNLDIRGSAAAIASALLQAEPRPVRLGAISLSGQKDVPYFFVCAAGVGPHVAVLQLASQRIKQFAGKAAYWAAGVRAWLREPPMTFEAVVTNRAGTTSTWRVSEALALRVGALNVWLPGGELEGDLLRLAMVPATSRIGLASAVTRAILARKVAEAASDTELEALLRRNRDLGSRGDSAVFYQDAVRVVCRPLAGSSGKRFLSAQADGEVLGNTTTTIEMSGQSLQLLCPGPS